MTPRSPFIGALGLGLLGVLVPRSIALLLPLRTSGSPMPGGFTLGLVTPVPPRNAFDRRMREASRWHLQAWRAFNEECEAMEAWDSALDDSATQAGISVE